MMPAGEFKAKCLGLMDEVQDTGEEIVITKHGQPVAKLVPITGGDIRPFVGRSSGVIEATPDDLLAPEGADWELGDDL
jgi:prevent-host-death family protein